MNAYTRRGFLCGAGVGLAAGVPLAWLGLRDRHPMQTVKVGTPVADAMPGPFPGRVVEVHGKTVLDDAMQSSPDVVKQMVERGMRELVGADGSDDAWRRFFQKGDVIAIKVNPVGRAHNDKQVAAISSPALVVEVVRGLKAAGVRPQDIILYDRYAKQFREAGYEALLRSRPMEGVRWFAAAYEYNNPQLDIEGYDGFEAHRDAHILGYDPDQFLHMGFCYDDPTIHHPKDDRRFRSHLAVVLTRMVNKVINLPVLKDHGSAGVTLALKNLSHGMCNNVSRSHLPRSKRQDSISGPNQCNVFIPTAVNHPLMRQKVTLHILDGLVGVYQGGPSTSDCVWPHRTLFFATDPVALDHIGWDIVDAKRVEKGMTPVARTGLQFPNSGREAFDRRQPEHIILAGGVGLGSFDRHQIDHRRIRM
ncbi:MAG: DUF362 domain-containing protein [Gemmataceae bacterium]|nr:DUF362 domain-containing protein [Gemmataceae bacterium]